MSDSPDSRLERLRHGQLAIKVENLPSVSSSTARFLGVVYDGGHIPTSGGRFFLTHPAQINDTEDEADEPTISVDTSQTQSVLLINYSAKVGDLLLAYSVGGRFVAEGYTPAEPCTGCLGCPITICILGCVSPAMPGDPALGLLDGVAIEIKDSMGTVLGSDTTDTSGCVTIDIGTYVPTAHWEATKSGFTPITDGVLPGACCHTAATRCMELDSATEMCESNCGPEPSTVTITESGFPGATTGSLTSFGHRCLGTQTKWKGTILPFSFSPRIYDVDTTGGTVSGNVSGPCFDSRCVLVVDSYSCDPLMIVLKAPPNPAYGAEGCDCLFGLATDPADVTITISA